MLEGWKNIYEYSIKTINRLNVPYFVLRFDQYLENQIEFEEKILKFCNLQKIEKTKTSNSHPCGG